MVTRQIDEKAVFNSARCIADAAARDNFLTEACGDDNSAIKRIRELLRIHEQEQSFLESPAAERPSIAEQPGTVIGRYRLLEQIGEGGFGVVFSAEQERPVRRRVALKVIKPGMDTHQVIARFEAERQALAMMDHPSIAKVFDAGATETGRPYFVMELVQGVPITEYCDQCNLSTTERLQLLIAVCHAVHHAHQKGMIHRDIKPTNVLVAIQDGQPAPKIIDFGVAKALNQRLTEHTLATGYAQMIGTPLYMSPEQAELSPLGADTRSDIYSLGVLLYELLAGTTPFDKGRLHSANYDELRRILREEEPPRPSTRLTTLAADRATTIAEQRRTDIRRLRQTVRGDLDWIVMKCLEKDRNRRYDTASTLARDIERYLNDEPVQACPPSAAYRVHKFARRHIAALVTVTIVSMALLIGTAVSIWQAVLATRAVAREGQAAAEAKAQSALAEGNLNLALQALDAVYLNAIGEEKLLHQSAVQQGELAVASEDQPLSDLERELLKRGLSFYDQFARQNVTSRGAALKTAHAFKSVGFLQAGLGDRQPALEAFREAIVRFESLTRDDPRNAGKHRDLAWSYIGLASVLQDWSAIKSSREKARIALTSAIALEPDKFELYLQRGDVSAQLHDSQQAETDYDKALALGADDPKLLRQSADFASWDCKPAITQRLAKRALEVAPENSWNHLLMASVLTDGYSASPFYFGDDRLNVIYMMPKPEPVLEHFARAIDLAPNMSEAYTRRARFHLRRGDVENAATDASRALELNPDGESELVVSAEVYRAKDKYEDALALLAKVLRLKPHHRDAHLLSGQVYMHMGQYQDAVTSLSAAIELAPDEFAIYKRRATCFFRLGDYARALADLKTALEIKPQDFSVFTWIPPSLWQECPDNTFGNGLLALADTALQQSKTPFAYLQRGRLYLELDQSEKADADFRKAAELNPKSPGALNNLAWLLCAAPEEARNAPLALRLAKKVVDLLPEDGEAWNTLGVAHYRSGNMLQAVEALQKSMELRNGGDALDWFFLAMCHWNLGQKKEAVNWYDKADGWMKKNQLDDEELVRFRAEAAELLGLATPGNNGGAVVNETPSKTTDEIHRTTNK
jgi:serine/threonine protein kinase/tetratricopeptide (TPR) repeat protein